MTARARSFALKVLLASNDWPLWRIAAASIAVALPQSVAAAAVLDPSATALAHGLGAGLLLYVLCVDVLGPCVRNESAVQLATHLVLGVAVQKGFHCSSFAVAHMQLPRPEHLAPVGWSLLAGLCTSLGAGVVFCFKKVSPAMNATLLGNAAGVMTCLSLFDILAENWGRYGAPRPIALFAVGALVFFAMNAGLKALPFSPDEAFDYALPTDAASLASAGAPARSAAMRSGVLLALVLAVHNLPEASAPLVLEAAAHHCDLGVFALYA